LPQGQNFIVTPLLTPIAFRFISGAVDPGFVGATHETAVVFLHEENQSLNCTIKEGFPFPDLHWERQNAMVYPSSEYFDVRVDGNSTLLTFKSVIDYTDEGDYKCVASNLAGRAFKTFDVRVRGLYEIPRQNLIPDEQFQILLLLCSV
jgi:hypothetical protein